LVYDRKQTKPPMAIIVGVPWAEEVSHHFIQCFFQAVFGCQNDTLKFCNDILKFESQYMILPCIEVK